MLSAAMDKLLGSLLFFAVVISTPVTAWGSCKNVCGTMPVKYPFGSEPGCGSPLFQKIINCTNDTMHLYTPTGQYPIQSIDYTNNVIIIQDLRTSTCASMQRSASFGLQVGAPLSVVHDTFVLLGCSATSSVYASLSPLCDAGGTPICHTLYNCSSITQIGLPVGGPPSSCCVYSSGMLKSSPFEINLELLGCVSYTSIYSFGPGSSPNYEDPSHWAYGIALQYYYDQSISYASCRACQQTNGMCAYNIYGFVCICSAGVNTTTKCYEESGQNLGIGSPHAMHQSLWTTGISMIWFFSSMLS